MWFWDGFDRVEIEGHLFMKNTRPTLVVLVRHAQSARNIAKKDTVYFADEDARMKVKGIPDHKINITPEGIIQAQKTGQALRKRFGIFDYAYTSGYNRTVQTLDNILEAYSQEERNKIKVRSNPFIRERDPGYTYDMTKKEAEKHFPWLQDYWNTHGGYLSAPPGGESLAKVSERVYTFLNMLFRDRAGQRVMIITHGGTLRCFRALLERWDYDRATSWPEGERPENCGVTVYKHSSKENKLVLQEYNTTYW